jgi:hypothetical protein
MRSNGSRMGIGVPTTALLLALAGAVAGVSAVPAQFPPPARPPKPVSQVTPPQASPSELPSARSVIDRHIAAIGGREAILSHTSTHATGTIAIPSAGMTGTLEVFAKKPNRTVVKMTIGGVGETVEAYNGAIGWQISPMTGPALLEGKELAEKRFDADFYGELKDDSRYESMKTEERATFDGRPCYKLRLVRKGGGEDIEYYDVATGLKAGTVTTRETVMGTVNATLTETEYRKFGNLMHATKATITAMGLQQVMTILSVEYDSVPDATFEPPAAIQALLK